MIVLPQDEAETTKTALYSHSGLDPESPMHEEHPLAMEMADPCPP